MATVTYGTSGLATTVTIRPRGATISVGFTSSIALVGGYDASNGNGSPNSVEYVADETDASDLFGEGSELHHATDYAYKNDVSDVYCIAVEETNTTESVTSSASGTLSNTPFDPNVNTEHSITFTDTSNSTDFDTNIVYGTVEQPSSSETVNVNPVSGEWEASTTSDFDITYDYGDYATALDKAASLDVRKVIALTEDDTYKSDAIADLDAAATDFDFKRAVSGAKPSIDVSAISDYTPSNEDQRLVEVAPSRDVLDDGTHVRMAAAVGAKMAAQPLGSSVTYSNLNGINDLHTKYRPSEAIDFDSVTAVTEGGEIVEGVTTSSESKFSDVFQCEIIDTVALALHQIAKDYAGDAPNIDDERANLRSDMIGVLASFATQNPPLLAAADGSQPYAVQTDVGSNDDAVAVNVGIDVLDIIKEVSVNIDVGTIVTYGGAE